MAYSGLGSGTQADPYQITTVSQFKEMNVYDTYTGVYFKLMNDLDYSSETEWSLPYVSCILDGNNKTLNSIPCAGTGLGGSVYNIKNINLNFSISTYYSATFQIFGGINGLLSGINITVNNTTATPIYLCNGNVGNDITKFTATGAFSKGFAHLYAGRSMKLIDITNTYEGPCPLIDEISGNLQYFRYNKPTTNLVADGSLLSTTLYQVFNVRNGIVTGNVNITGDYKFGYIDLVLTVGSSGKMGYIEDISIIGNVTTTGTTKTCYACDGSGVYIDESRASIKRLTYWGTMVRPFPGSVQVFGYNSAPKYCYFNSTLLSSPGMAGQIPLTTSEFQNTTSFATFDFSSVWSMGVTQPEIIIIDHIVSILSNTQSDKLTLTTTCGITDYAAPVDNYGVDIYNASSELIGTLQNELVKSTIFPEFADDEILTLNAYTYKGVAKIVTDTKTYRFMSKDVAFQTTPITSLNYTTLNNGTNAGRWIHGTCIYNGYLYGSSRNDFGAYTNGCIVRCSLTDISSYTLFPIYLNASYLRAWNMDSLVQIGKYLYTVAISTSGPDTTNYLVKFDTETTDYQVYQISSIGSGGFGKGCPSCTDGTYLYVYTAKRVGDDTINKINPDVFNSSNKFNVGSNWDTQSVDYVYLRHNGFIYPHAMCVDDAHLYIGFGYGTSVNNYEIQKVLKSNMSFVAYASVPKMTDDMCQTDTHLFIGIEPYTSVSVGYNVGSCAIRKSDFAVTMIPKLHSTDLATTNSYASLIFGNYLVECKTNCMLYAIDISDVDNWSMSENIGARTLKAYKMYKPDGATLFTLPINELFLKESGEFVGFNWGPISDVSEFELTGLNYFAAPTVVTDDAAIVNDNDVSLAGYIHNTGGKTITAIGIILGQSADLSDGISYPITPVSMEFEKAFNDLEFGTYYFQTYATNAEGTGYGEIKSFTLEVPYTEPGKPTGLDKFIQVEITINWVAPEDDGGTHVTGYKIERKLSGEEWVVVVANTENTDTTYTEVVEQGAYQYRISAITVYATSAPSATLDVNAVVGGGGGTGTYKIYIGSTEIAII